MQHLQISQVAKGKTNTFVLEENRQDLLLADFVEGKPRPEIHVESLYTTVKDRVQGEDIKNATK